METKVAEQTKVYTTRDTCRMCDGKDLTRVWSFGDTPLANSYLKPEQVGSVDEPFAPLTIFYCGDCHLVQMLDVVDPDVMFSNYLYVSSTSPKFVAHFEDYAKSLISRFGLDSDDLVVDVGSNDGVLLKPFKEAGVKILGIDPAQNLADMANADGIETIADYFTPEVAEKIVSSKGKARVIAANNVFAHTDDVNLFVDAVKTLLTDDGVYVFEAQYLGSLMEKNLFDIVYHEHVCYYSVHPLVKFFDKQGMEVFDVERPTVHGGSLRVFVQKAGGPHKREARLDEVLLEEEKNGLDKVKTYKEFMRRIEKNRERLQMMLKDIKAKGKRIVGYGAPAKATTLLYAFGLDGDTIDYIVDDDKKFKQGMVMPGNHIPIMSPEKLYEDKPDYCLVLAWNFAEPIMENHARFVEQGGKFIVPIPEPKII
jgi:SAM-dependent methyltransferase